MPKGFAQSALPTTALFRRKRWPTHIVAIGHFLAFFPLALAQSVLAGPISVSLEGTTGYPTQRVLIPVIVSVDSDTVAGYQLEYSMDRPGVVEFVAETVIETVVVCTNPPMCTVADTTIDTVTRVPVEAAATLSSAWEFIAAVNLGSPTFLRVTAVANLSGDIMTPPILPPQTDTFLILIAGDIPCHVDPINGPTVTVIPNKADFSDNHGQLTSPVSTTGAMLTVLDPIPGDLNLSGQVDAVDLAQFIDCVFFGGCPVCDAIPVDFTCDGFPTAEDLALLIDHVFFGTTAPPPCGP